MTRRLGFIASLGLWLLSLPAAAQPAPSRPSSKSPESVASRLADYQARYPQLCRLVRLGDSHQGRPVWALAIGRNLRDPDDRPAVSLNGAHHGGELLSVEIVLDAIELLLTASAPDGGATDPALARRLGRFVDELVIWAVPMVAHDAVSVATVPIV